MQARSTLFSSPTRISPSPDCHSFKLIFSPGYETEPQTINVVDLEDETRLVVSGLAAVLLDALYELGQ